MIKCNCPACARPFEVHDTLAGKSMACPDCQSTVMVPAASSEEAAFIPQQKSVQGLALGSLICGFLSLPINLCFCGAGVILSVVAIGLGIAALLQMKKPDVAPNGKGSAITGIISGGICLLITLSVLALFGAGSRWLGSKSKEIQVSMEEERRSRPSEISDAAVKFSAGNLEISSTVTATNDPIKISGSLHVEVFSWNQNERTSPSKPGSLNSSNRLLQKWFQADTGDCFCVENRWEFRSVLHLPPGHKDEFVAVRFTFSGNQMGAPLVLVTDPLRIK